MRWFFRFGDGFASSFAALETLKQLNDENKRKLPEDAPLDFVPKSLCRIVEPDGESPDRRAWECALLLKVRDEEICETLGIGKTTFYRYINAD